MLQSSKHTSHRNSPRFTGSHTHCTSSPTSLPSTNLYSIPQSFGPDSEAMVPSPSRSSMFAVPRSMESSIDRVADLPAGDLSEFLYQNKPWWAKDLGLGKESTGRSSHHRESSLTSTLGSTGPNSPCSPNISTPQIAATDSVDDAFRDGHASSPWNYHFTNPDSMPLQQDQYLYTGPQLYGLQMNNPSSKMPYTMNTYTDNQSSRQPKALDAHTAPGSSEQGLSRPSELNPKQEATNPSPVYSGTSDKMGRRRVVPDVPKLDRTMTDVYNDGLYSPNLDIISSASSNSKVQASPASNVFSRRLNTAESLAHPMHGRSDPSTLHPNHSQRHTFSQYHSSEASLHDDRLLRTVSEVNSPQTISPQDSMLDFSEADCANNFPLFARPESSRFGGMDHLTDEEVSLGHCESGRPQYSMVDEDTVSNAQHYISSGTPGVYASHGLSAFEAEQGLSSTLSLTGSDNANAIAGPSGLRSGGNDGDGTYSCTYHGCMLRFDTPALLQKHKREGHRQAGGLKSTQRGMKSNVIDTQAGPHRCYRINPGTGKVCRAVFSRPYDLTRHEDTIHNARKQKVRCDLCTEEKLFSRADALTRHYRVCHPDVELPGKHRRRRTLNQD